MMPNIHKLLCMRKVNSDVFFFVQHFIQLYMNMQENAVKRLKILGAILSGVLLKLAKIVVSFGSKYFLSKITSLRILNAE